MACHREKRVALAWDIDGSLARHYCGDIKLLKQVLVNLLGNAIKFSPPHKRVTLRVQLIRPAPVPLLVAPAAAGAMAGPVPWTRPARRWSAMRRSSNASMDLTDDAGSAGDRDTAAASADAEADEEALAPPTAAALGSEAPPWSAVPVHRVCFAVDDEGVGIPPGVTLADLCQPFAQVSPTRSPVRASRSQARGEGLETASIADAHVFSRAGRYGTDGVLSLSAAGCGGSPRRQRRHRAGPDHLQAVCRSHGWPADDYKRGA